MSSGLVLPRLYVVLDAETMDRRGMDAVATAVELAGCGVGLLQYRDKRGDRAEVVRVGRGMVEGLRGSGCRLILNDYAELVAETGFDGVHVGQGDLDAFAARAVVGRGKIVGVSTHTDAQVEAADVGPADYVAVGPVFGTRSKVDAEPVVGLAGIRRARELTAKPLVAIGGISIETAGEVRLAGADAIAVIGAVIGADAGVSVAAKRLMDVLGQ